MTSSAEKQRQAAAEAAVRATPETAREAALARSDGFPVPTPQEFVDRVLEQLGRLDYEVRRRTPDLSSAMDAVDTLAERIGSELWANPASQEHVRQGVLLARDALTEAARGRVVFQPAVIPATGEAAWFHPAKDEVVWTLGPNHPPKDEGEGWALLYVRTRDGQAQA